MDMSAEIARIFAISAPVAKAEAVRLLKAELDAGRYSRASPLDLPIRPGRPEKPVLAAPKDVPRRRITRGADGRIALIHAIAHIELNAIDLALDMCVRFQAEHLPFDFVKDWMSVADDEARHFLMLENRLAELGSYYGALSAHDGLWQAAEKTATHLLGRLAIAPLVLEARGLDVTPQLIDKMIAVEDEKTAACLEIIMTDEVGHVATGKRWYDYQCGMEKLDPVSTWHKLVGLYFHGALKPPFNIDARKAARFSAAFYGPLAAQSDNPTALTG